MAMVTGVGVQTRVVIARVRSQKESPEAVARGRCWFVAEDVSADHVLFGLPLL
jgi:hypothetical protein